jgi:hypothetical protein
LAQPAFSPCSAKSSLIFSFARERKLARQREMRGSSIYWQNKTMVRQQRQFRAAADIVTAALMTFPEIAAIGLTGSTAKLLWKEVPRFREFKKAGIKVWHECGDVDLAVWLDSRERLGGMRLAKDRALRQAYEAGTGPGVANHQIDIFLFEPKTDRYLGRLCSYSECPKGKPACLTPGCGDIAFNKIHADFSPDANLLALARQTMLYERGRGILMSALDLPVPQD